VLINARDPHQWTYLKNLKKEKRKKEKPLAHKPIKAAIYGTLATFNTNYIIIIIIIIIIRNVEILNKCFSKRFFFLVKGNFQRIFFKNSEF
jgi:hypothetical protein